MAYKSVSKPKGGSDSGGKKPDQKREVLERAGAASESAAVGAGAKPRGDQKRLVSGKSAPLTGSGSGFGFLSIIGVDERTRIRDTEVAPFSLICALEISGPWGDFVGTAWFAGPKTLITAGHCVFDANQMGGWANKITVWPGRDGDETPMGPIVATQFSTVDKWEHGQDADHDFAAIHLPEDGLKGKSPFRIASLPDADLADHLINVSGYPGDKGGTEQWWAKNRIRSVKPLRLFYDVDTFGGQSGGPAYIVESEGAPPTVVGIHAYGTGGTPSDVPFEVNSAPRINSDKLAQIKAWVNADTPGYLS